MLTRPNQNTLLENEYVALSPVLLYEDLHELYHAACVQTNGTDLFQYHANVPSMNTLETFEYYLQTKINTPHEFIFKIFSKRLQQKVGAVSLMNIRPEHGVVEVGSVWLTLSAQRTEINTNTMFLIFEYVFEHLKYRRIEWKCNNLNTVSKTCALRLGFEYEGLFRQHMISRGENRDTAWFAMLDKDWPEKKRLLDHITVHRTSIAS